MALTLRNHRVVQTILICCFAGSFCTASACAGFGMACWGGHGKRNNIQDVPIIRILAAKTLFSESSQNDIAPYSKPQRILSRLINRQSVLPLTDGYYVRWNGFPKEKIYVPPQWEHNAIPMNDESIESIRIPINNNAQDTMRSMNEKFENTPKILLISPDEYDKLIIDPQKLNVLKFLNEANGNSK